MRINAYIALGILALFPIFCSCGKDSPASSDTATAPAASSPAVAPVPPNTAASPNVTAPPPAAKEIQIPPGQETAALDAARQKYLSELTAADIAREKAALAAKENLLAAYDKVIAAAMHRGGGEALDLANQLNAERKSIATAFNPTRRELLDLIPGKKWFWHWENEDRNNPATLIVTPQGDISDTKSVMKMELRWVLESNGHFLFPTDETHLRGFFIPSGRKVGFFADKLP